MNTDNLYVNYEQFFNYCEENRLLDDTQIEVLKQAAVNVEHVFLDYFVPVRTVDDAMRYCREKIEWHRRQGSVAHMECYNDFIEILKSMSMEADEHC